MPRAGRRQPRLAEPEADHALEPLGRLRRRLAVAEEPALEVVVEHAGRLLEERREDRPGAGAKRLQRLRSRVAPDLETRLRRRADAEAAVPAEVDVRLHQHPAELAEVDRAHAQRQRRAARPADLDEDGELAPVVVLRRDGALADDEVEVRLV